jgi:hypothetical protein
MRLIRKIIGGISMLCAFGCSSSNPEQQRQELIRWLDHHLHQLSQHVASDIESEKKGFYPHAGKTEYHSRGYIEYVLREKTGNRLEVSARSPLTVDDIKATPGFQTLSKIVSDHGYQVELNRISIDGDEVDSSISLDEYIDDPQDYFVITVSGWQV